MESWEILKRLSTVALVCAIVAMVFCLATVMAPTTTPKSVGAASTASSVADLAKDASTARATPTGVSELRMPHDSAYLVEDYQLDDTEHLYVFYPAVNGSKNGYTTMSGTDYQVTLLEDELEVAYVDIDRKMLYVHAGDIISAPQNDSPASNSASDPDPATNNPDYDKEPSNAPVSA